MLKNYYDYGLELIGEKDYDRAILAFSEAVAHGVKPERSRLNIGLCYQSLGKNEIAVEYLKGILKDIDDPYIQMKGYNMLGICHFNLEEYGKALQNFNVAHCYGESQFAPYYLHKIETEFLPQLSTPPIDEQSLTEEEYPIKEEVPAVERVDTIVIFKEGVGFEVVKFFTSPEGTLREEILETVICRKKDSKKFKTIMDNLTNCYSPDKFIGI